MNNINNLIILNNCTLVLEKDANGCFDIELINHIRNNVTILVIASSGTGKVEHFSEVLEKTKEQKPPWLLGIFHREEISLEAMTEYMRER